VAWTLTGLGTALVELGEHQRAIDSLERAVAIQQTRDAVPESLAESRFALARALWEAPPSAGRDRARAFTLVEQAHHAYLELGEPTADAAARTATWLADHATTSRRG
jgi:tetratricopeptide (TPR) repeat protein